MGLPILNKINHPASRQPSIFTPNAIQDLITFNLKDYTASTSEGGGGTATGVLSTGSPDYIPVFSTSTLLINSVLRQDTGVISTTGNINFTDALGTFSKRAIGVDGIQFKDSLQTSDDTLLTSSTIRAGEFLNAQTLIQGYNTSSLQWINLAAFNSGTSPAFNVLQGDISASTTFGGLVWSATFLTNGINTPSDQWKWGSVNVHAETLPNPIGTAYPSVNIGTLYDNMIYHNTTANRTRWDFRDQIDFYNITATSAPYYNNARTPIFHIGPSIVTSQVRLDVNGVINANGGVTLKDNVYLYLGGGPDWRIWSTGTHMYIDCDDDNAKDIFIRNVSNDNIFKFDTSSQTFHANGDVVAYSASI
jgi:hypothetical protein